MSTPCCAQHIDGPTGSCCMDDCVPCCASCPTCPTAHNFRGAGALPRRDRDERGDSGIIGSLIVIVVLIAVAKVAFDVDLLRYFIAIVDWAEGAVRAIAEQVQVSV